MQRIYILQRSFKFSDPAAEEVLSGSRAMWNFVGLDLGRERLPDETTICKFHHMMGRHNLGDQLFLLV